MFPSYTPSFSVVSFFPTFSLLPLSCHSRTRDNGPLHPSPNHAPPTRLHPNLNPDPEPEPIARPDPTRPDPTPHHSQPPILALEILIHRIIRRPEPVNVRLVDRRPWETDGGACARGDDSVVRLSVGVVQVRGKVGKDGLGTLSAVYEMAEDGMRDVR